MSIPSNTLIRFLSLLFITTLLSACTMWKSECASLKNGSFNYYRDGATTPAYRIERTQNEQIERILGTETVYKYKIEWMDKCSYKLYDQEVVYGVDLYPESDIDTVYVFIRGIENDTHQLEFGFGDTIIGKSKMVRITD